MAKKLKLKKPHKEDIKSFVNDFSINTTRAFIETIKSNETAYFMNSAMLCGGCYRLIKYNFIPVATIGVCFAFSAYSTAPLYKSVKIFLNNPLKGFKD